MPFGLLVPNHQSKLFDIYPSTANLGYPALVVMRHGERVDEPIPARLSLFLHYLKSRPTKIAKCSQLLVRKISEDCSYTLSTGSAPSSPAAGPTTLAASSGPIVSPQPHGPAARSGAEGRFDVYASLISAKIWLAIVSDASLAQYERDWQTELLTSLFILYYRGKHIPPIHELVLTTFQKYCTLDRQRQNRASLFFNADLYTSSSRAVEEAVDRSFDRAYYSFYAALFESMIEAFQRSAKDESEALEQMERELLVLFSGVSYSCSVDKLKHLYLEETLLFRSKNTLDTKERHARAVLFRSKYIEGLLPRVHSEPQVKVLIGTLIRWIGEEGKEDEKQQLSNLLLYSIPSFHTSILIHELLAAASQEHHAHAKSSSLSALELLSTFLQKHKERKDDSTHAWILDLSFILSYLTRTVYCASLAYASPDDWREQGSSEFSALQSIMAAISAHLQQSEVERMLRSSNYGYESQRRKKSDSLRPLSTHRHIGRSHSTRLSIATTDSLAASTHTNRASSLYMTAALAHGGRLGGPGSSSISSLTLSTKSATLPATLYRTESLLVSMTATKPSTETGASLRRLRSKLSLSKKPHPAHSVASGKGSSSSASDSSSFHVNGHASAGASAGAGAEAATTFHRMMVMKNGQGIDAVQSPLIQLHSYSDTDEQFVSTVPLPQPSSPTPAFSLLGHENGNGNGNGNGHAHDQDEDEKKKKSYESFLDYFIAQLKP